MKRIGILFIIFFSTLCLSAQEHNANLTKKQFEMQRLQRQGKTLEALDTACVILSYNPDSRTAQDFVYHHWDKTMRQANDRLSTLTDDESIEQTRERCELYRLIEDIHFNLRSVRLPLHGPNDSWVWQPEVGYYSGHYDDECHKGFMLVKQKADEALRAGDTELAKSYYEQALSMFLPTDNEKKSNRRYLTQEINGRISSVADSELLTDALFAYDLCSLSLWLTEQQDDIASLQTRIMQHISELYLSAAEHALSEGDTLSSEQYRMAAADWQINQTQTEQ